MIAVATFLAVIGVADIAASGLGGSVPDRRRLYVGWLTGSIGVAAIGVSLGFDAAQWWLSGAVVGVTLAGWLGPRGFNEEASPRAHALALTVLALGFGVTVLVGSSFSDISVPPIELSVTGLRGVSSVDFAVGVAVLLGLTTTANAVVRSSLIAVGADYKGGAARLRGGRLIGVLERYIIFGFAISGEAVAAAIVVSAKSLIRFPELREAADEGRGAVDELTEYFLLGSMLSWSIALLMAVLFG